MPTCYSTPKTHPAFPHFFKDLKDPRLTVKGNHHYPLEEILFLSISAVISGADSWTSISLFGRSKLDWLTKWYPYPHRTPSHDVLGRVFSALDPEVFNRCFVSWVDSIAQLTSGEVIAVDGKTIYRSAGKTAGKMVKGNQKGLKEQIEKVCSIAAIKDEYQSTGLGHGRIEFRKCEVVDQLRFLDDRDDWQDLKGIAPVSSRRINKQSGKESVETRYYITSLKPDAQLVSQ